MGGAGGCRTCPHGTARLGTEAAAGGFCLSGHDSPSPHPHRRGNAARMLWGRAEGWGCGPAPADVSPQPPAGPAPRPAVAALMSSPAGPRGLQCSPGVGNPAASGRRGLGGPLPGWVPCAAGDGLSSVSPRQQPGFCPCCRPISEQTEEGNRRRCRGHPAHQPLPSVPSMVPALRCRTPCRGRGRNVRSPLGAQRRGNLR